MKRLREFLDFLSACFRLTAGERPQFILYVVLSVLSALTEGLGLSMLAPLLQGSSGMAKLSSIPIAGALLTSLDQQDFNSRIQLVSMILAVILVLRGVLQYFMDSINQLLPQRIQCKMSRLAYDSLMNARIGYLNAHDAGYLTMHIKDLPDRIGVLLTFMATMLSSFLVLGAYAGLMLSISWQMTVVSLIVLGFVVGVIRMLSSGPIRRAGQALTDNNARRNHAIFETISGMKMIKLTAAEHIMVSRYAETIRDQYKAMRRLAVNAALSSPLLTTSAGLFICALLVGNSLTHPAEDQGWVGYVLLFVVVLFRTLGPVSQINTARSRIISDISAFNAMETFLADTQENVAVSGSRPFTGLTDSIVFDKVNFAYEDGGAGLHDLSFSIRKGETIAVVGPSGAGKSTMIGALSHLLIPQDGRILIDGVDLRDLSTRDWRRSISVVSQDIFIFNDTVTNNLCFGLDDIPFAKVAEAAKLAAADEFIEKMAQGYDTILGDRGVRLSGGQQQRIAIARAFLASPDLLVLDEATSHLDTLTEHAIQEATEVLRQGRTMLIVAHRLSTIRKADRVLVLKEGRLVEQGRHDELVAQKGIYWQMLEQQRLGLAED